MTGTRTEDRNATPSAPAPAGPCAAPFRDEKECLDAWFGALGPMSGNPSTTHAALFSPVGERLPALRRLAERNRATREAGGALRLFDAFDALDLPHFLLDVCGDCPAQGAARGR